MFIPTFFQRFTAQKKREVLIQRVIFTSSLKCTRTKKAVRYLSGKTLRTMRQYVMRPIFINKNLQMLLSLMTSKKVRSVNVLKKRKEKCRQVAETNKLLKKKKKQEEFKESEEAY